MLEIKNLSKTYGKRKVLDDISFEVREGTITAIVGVNGVGKTTIMNAIMRLIHFDQGEITLDGEAMDDYIYNQIAYVPDELIIDQSKTIGRLLEDYERAYTSFNPKRAAEIMEFFELDRKQVVNLLSKGNRAKVNLLLPLSLDVRYILMDEPFSGIDIFTREKIAEVFTSDLILDRGVLITTHEIDDVELLLDEVILLDEGRIHTRFSPEEERLLEGRSVVDVMREVYGR